MVNKKTVAIVGAVALGAYFLTGQVDPSTFSSGGISGGIVPPSVGESIGDTYNISLPKFNIPSFGSTDTTIAPTSKKPRTPSPTNTSRHGGGISFATPTAKEQVEKGVELFGFTPLTVSSNEGTNSTALQTSFVSKKEKNIAEQGQALFGI